MDKTPAQPEETLRESAASAAVATSVTQVPPPEAPPVALKSPRKKMGRPRKHYVARNGSVIEGLNRSPDGRWRIQETDITFVEPDERFAIARFRKWQEEQGRYGTKIGETIYYADGNGDFERDVEQRIAAGAGVRVHPAGDPIHGGLIVTDNSLTDAQWIWLREQIVKRPKWVAERVGIEQIGYLEDLKAPVPSPTLTEVGEYYESYAQRKNRSAHERFKVKAVWQSFKTFMEGAEVTTLRKIEPDDVRQWSETYAEGRADKTIRNDLMRVRAVLNRFLKSGKAQDDTSKATAALEVMDIPTVKGRNPQPISRSDFHALLTSASALDDKVERTKWKAALLLALNCAFYLKDVRDVRWDDLNLAERYLSGIRIKTGIPRIAVLWERTVEALKDWQNASGVTPEEIKRGLGLVFPSPSGVALDMSRWHACFRKVRTSAEVSPEFVGFRMLRDGAYSAAGNVSKDLSDVKALAGHSFGMPDYYLKLHPEKVADICRAIEDHYFPQTTQTKMPQA